jgi:NADP-dependent 3-hydroxy acid dehydrogenase YdfG
MAESNDCLAGRAVIVTGASSGIGAATCQALVGRGAQVFALARSREKLQSLETISRANLAVEAADVRSRDDMERVAKAVLDRFGACDAIVCNAGVGEYADFLDMTPETVTEIVETNLLGTVWSIRAVLPHMLDAGRGDIIVVSSVVAVMDSAGEAVYAATKAGQRSLAGCLDLELKSKGIRVSTILPGGVKTEFAMGRGRTPDMPDLNVMLDPGDVAAAIVTVLSQPRHVRTTTWGLSHIDEK